MSDRDEFHREIWKAYNTLCTEKGIPEQVQQDHQEEMQSLFQRMIDQTLAWKLPGANLIKSLFGDWVLNIVAQTKIIFVDDTCLQCPGDLYSAVDPLFGGPISTLSEYHKYHQRIVASNYPALHGVNEIMVRLAVTTPGSVTFQARIGNTTYEYHVITATGNCEDTKDKECYLRFRYVPDEWSCIKTFVPIECSATPFN